MQLTELFLEQLESEAGLTRKVLQRVPDGHTQWKPHQKSMLMGYLASLCASMPGWVVPMVEWDELDITGAGGGEAFKPRDLATSQALVEALDDGVAKARKVLAGTTDAHLRKPWRLLLGGRVIDEKPRYVNLRDGLFSHLAHHRGQLTVYLRLNDAPVPALYGPSADERV
ncbi:MAG TPA: hypothetical protein VNW46_13945 [Gemmatimonadaceae bacterium]|jgi:uncharacterized damage-inducible protein DinB|nr:hypothetical protein [Gemmatimonadaceae bacterium]